MEMKRVEHYYTQPRESFHDENGNNEFDKNFFGFPLEGFGFSNDANVFFGPPDFKEAAIEVAGVKKTIKIEVNYW